MSRFDRAWGLARSIAIYHAIPGRHRRLKRFYADFLRPGDLVFDIGAHAGNHLRAMAALGCRVVALEPQPDYARLLRAWFAASPDVVVVEAAAAAARGTAQLSISDRTPTVTTLASDWRDRRASDPEFARVRWNRPLEVDTTTLDALIERFGRPAFVKIDVEGSEPDVLAGLTTAVPALAFEYLPRALEHAAACVGRLATLGAYAFNWSVAETYSWQSSEWLSGGDLLASLRAPAARRRSGDVYARLNAQSHAIRGVGVHGGAAPDAATDGAR